MKKILYISMFCFMTFCLAAQQQNVSKSDEEDAAPKVMNNYTVVSMFGAMRNNGFQRGIDLQSKDRSVYALEKSNVIFYRKKSGRTIHYAGGDYLVIQGQDNQYRYKYSNLINDKHYTKTAYDEGEQIGEVMPDTDTYNTGTLNLEIEEPSANRFINPVSILKISDNVGPSIQDIYFRTAEGNTVSFLRDTRLNRGGSMFVRCKDRLTPALRYFTPYQIKVIVDGVETGGIKFDYIRRDGQKLLLSDTNMTFDDLYCNGQEFDYYIMDFNALPGLVGFQVIVMDYAENRQLYRKAMRIMPPEM